MQDCRGKRILRLVQLNNENLSKKPKVIVQQVATLNSCTTGLLEKEILQQQTVPESHFGSSHELDFISNENSPEEGVLEDQDEEYPFAASDKDDEEYDPNIEEDNNSDTSEGTEAPKEENPDRSRWYKADDKKCNRNLTKKCRNLGQPYTTKNGTKPAKAPQYVNCNSCRFKCSIKFSDAERTELGSSYWQLES
ncbi:unnamed protein product [Psylliodes chrysocephalus]|uniref:Uncharacterized protein n=1 Tax=Psylliodes chrysocephalus TaxID=3402493 RepID=A0A9P0CVR5_9CUCU|nr:unnamed protein product [Psylliodes chrysocephala]